MPINMERTQQEKLNGLGEKVQGVEEILNPI